MMSEVDVSRQFIEAHKQKYLNQLNEKQIEKLKEFRNAMDDILGAEHDEYFLLRWLRARKFDVPAAESMLRTSLKWRERMGADTILEDYQVPEVLKKYYPKGLIGHDKEGCPIWIVPFGNMDIKGLLYSAKKSDLLKVVVYELELSEQDMKDQSQSLGKVIECQSCIFDMENFSMKQITWKPALDLITHLVSLYEDNYPEKLKKAYVINAPKIFPVAYAIIKPFLSEETAKKIHVYAKGSWKGPVLEDIEPSEIPEHWGGTKTDQDGNPYCPSIICLGGPVPCSYYMAPSRRLSSDQDLQTVTVEKKGILPVELSVEEIGSRIKWAFQTENYDIAFGVFYKSFKEGSKEETLVANQRANCHLVPEDGEIKCHKIGKYILKFDNSFSWCRAKKLMYEVQVIPPQNKIKAPPHPPSEMEAEKQ